MRQLTCCMSTDCIEGCVCALTPADGWGPDGTCLSLKHTKLEGCKKCKTKNHCPGDSRGCSAKLGVCGTCAAESAREVTTACVPNSKSTSTKNTGQQCKTDSECKKDGCLCSGVGISVCYNSDAARNANLVRMIMIVWARNVTTSKKSARAVVFLLRSPE